MLHFACDYMEGAHPDILRRLDEVNMHPSAGYGADEFCEAAREKIRVACASPQAAVHFLVGGTQANLTVIASILRPHQGVLCAATGHINVHETGAVEACGHKALGLPHKDGKITAAQVARAVEAHYADGAFQHIVQPGMVYISQPTEFGTLYSLDELTALSETCRRYGLPLYADGARLGYALAAGDVTLPDLARLCDVFYIGGTKCGMLFGEAVVIAAPALQKDFRYHIKQRGGMLAKGRLLGIQFDTMFTDGLYGRVNARAVEQAMRVRVAFLARGVEMYIDSPTNQQFPALTRAQRDRLTRDFALTPWQTLDDGREVTRVCTSWATAEENLQKLLRAIADMPGA